EVGALPDGKLLDLRLDLAADRHRAGPLALGKLAHLGDQRIGVDPPQLRLVHVGDVQDRLRGEQEELAGARLLVVAERNAAPRPAPFDAPLTSPAMSTNSRAAGVVFFGRYRRESFSRRSSGTGTTPTLGSLVANG